MTDQPRILLSPPHMSGRERELVGEVFDSNFIAPAGPMIDRFEDAFCAMTGHKAAVALSSGTGAMDIALRLLDVEQGDDIWVADLTFIGGVSPVKFHGANPVFLDVSPETWTLDPTLLANELEQANRTGNLPRVVVPVDLYGQPCDLDQIVRVCDRYEIPVVVDSAEAMGTRYKDRHAGKGATLAIYSFNGNKIITTGGGGLLASDDGEMIARAKYLSQQARQSAAHYEHTETGYNYRMPSLGAAVGVGQLEVLDQHVERRRQIFAKYTEAFKSTPSISMMPEADYGTANRWLSVITLNPHKTRVTPAEICSFAETQNIECRPVWKPMSHQPVFANERFTSTGVSDRLFSEGVCLPSGSAMSEYEVERVVRTILAALD